MVFYRPKRCQYQLWARNHATLVIQFKTQMVINLMKRNTCTVTTLGLERESQFLRDSYQSVCAILGNCDKFLTITIKSASLNLRRGAWDQGGIRRVERRIPGSKLFRQLIHQEHLRKNGSPSRFNACSDSLNSPIKLPATGSCNLSNSPPAALVADRSCRVISFRPQSQLPPERLVQSRV